MNGKVELTNYSNIRKGNTLIRFVAGRAESAGAVVLVERQKDGAILLLTDVGHRFLGQPSTMIMRLNNADRN